MKNKQPLSWKYGKICGTVVSECPTHDAFIGSDAVEYYGGYLIAESVAPSNQALIAAAPSMLKALKHLEDFDIPMPYHAWRLVKSAIAKAEGGDL